MVSYNRETIYIYLRFEKLFQINGLAGHALIRFRLETKLLYNCDSHTICGDSGIKAARHEVYGLRTKFVFLKWKANIWLIDLLRLYFAITSVTSISHAPEKESFSSINFIRKYRSLNILWTTTLRKSSMTQRARFGRHMDWSDFQYISARRPCYFSRN